MKDAAAKGRGEDDALGVATARFLERARSAGDGFPSLGDAPASEVTGDVVLRARAVNRPGAPPSPDADPASASASPAASAFDALLADLLAAQKLALDAETVAALAAFYRARLASATEVTPAARVDECIKVLAQLLQEGGAHILPSEVDALLPALLAKVAQTRTRRGGNERPSSSSASSSSADADASDPAERPSRDKETSRHALNAIGALVSRSPAGAVAEAARVAVGEALVAARLDDAALEARREGSQSQVSQFRKSARGGSPWTPSPAGTSPPSRGARTCARRRTARAGRSRRGRIASSRPWSRTSARCCLTASPTKVKAANANANANANASRLLRQPPPTRPPRRPRRRPRAAAGTFPRT